MICVYYHNFLKKLLKMKVMIPNIYSTILSWVGEIKEFKSNEAQLM